MPRITTPSPPVQVAVPAVALIVVTSCAAGTPTASRRQGRVPARRRYAPRESGCGYHAPFGQKKTARAGDRGPGSVRRRLRFGGNVRIPQ